MRRFNGTRGILTTEPAEKAEGKERFNGTRMTGWDGLKGFEFLWREKGGTQSREVEKSRGRKVVVKRRSRQV